MMKFNALLMKKKQPRMNGKMMTLTFFKLYTVYIKIRTILLLYLFVKLFKERHKFINININKLIHIKTVI